MAVAFSENRGVYTSVQGLSNLPSGTPTTGGLTCVTDQNRPCEARSVFTTERDLALCTSTSTTRRPNSENYEKNNTDLQGDYKDDKYKQGYFKDFLKNYFDNPDADVIDNVVTYYKREDHSGKPVGTTNEVFSLDVTDENKDYTYDSAGIVKPSDNGAISPVVSEGEEEAEVSGGAEDPGDTRLGSSR